MRVQDRLHAFGQAAMRLDQQDDDIGVRGPGPGGGDHRAVQPAARAKEARRIDKDDLRGTFHADAPDPRPRRLHLMRDDRDLGPHHPVQKRRFARIGFADQGDETGACGRLRRGCCRPRPCQSSLNSIRARSAFAAACSAWRFDPARASSDAPLASRDLDGEHRRVVGAFAAGFGIDGRRLAARLRPFLQRGLGVAGIRPRRRLIRVPHSRSTTSRAASIARIKVDGGDHRLHRVAQQRLLAPPARHHLGPAELQHRRPGRCRGPRRRRFPCAPAR